MRPPNPMDFAEQIGEYYVAEMGFPPIAGRTLGYLAVCEPAEQTVADLAEALLASRSAITQAVVLLTERGYVRRYRKRGDRVDHVVARLDSEQFSSDLDATGYARQAQLLREGAEMVAEDDSGRREALAEIADLYDFLAERLPQVKAEWLERRSARQARA